MHATPRTITAGDVSLYTALYGMRFAVTLVATSSRAARPPARAGRRPARVPHGLRQDRARRLAQRGREPRLREGHLRRARLSRRHREHALDRHRSQGDQQRQERRRLRALGRQEPARRGRPRLRALGHGEQADPSSPAPEAVVPELPKAVAATRLRIPAGLHTRELRSAARRLARTSGATTRSARRSITSTE